MTAMVTRHSHLGGNYVAECPDCHEVCAYWEDEDLNEAGELECSACSARAERLADLLAQLTDDGDSVELDPTHSLVLHIEPDECSSINDYECYGRISWVETDRWTGQDKPRPVGFTGAARKLQADRSSQVWWEPYREGHKVYDSPENVRLVRDLLEYGFACVSLELRETLVDSLGHEHAVSIDWASLGGIDSLENGYLAEVLSELVDELDLGMVTS